MGGTKPRSSWKTLLLILAGFLMIALLPPAILIGPSFYLPLTFWDQVFNSILVNVVAGVAAVFATNEFKRHPQRHPATYVPPILLTIYGLLLALILILRAAYSIKLISLGVGLCFLSAVLFFLLGHRHIMRRLYVVPFGLVDRLQDGPHCKFKLLQKPALPAVHFDGIAADLVSNEIPADWQRFLTRCVLKGIPVYGAGQLLESLTGRVDIGHLSENELGDLVPPALSQGIKWGAEVLFLLATLPVWLPVILLIAIWITLDSPGGPLYIQDRMGYMGKTFRVFKFRSMTVDHQGGHFTLKDEADRITRVGRVIRKYRLDELPQFLNVIKGDMSLIGPRPESSALAEWYDHEVPFFAYRHIVRPGISGWAQVMHGYAAGVEEMNDKLAYDFYYIKHFSFWLDLLIWYKTLRTILTGFGSR